MSRAVLALFLNGLARSLVIIFVNSERTPCVCCKRSIPSCVSGHADSSSPGSNCPSIPACIVGCTRGESSSSKNSADLSSSWDAHVKRENEPPESPSIVHAEPRPPSGISSTLLATPVDHNFARARYSLPPPRKKHRRGLPPVHPKRLPVHPRHWLVRSNLNPTMFVSVVITYIEQ